MSDITLEMDHVFKKFKKGETYDSLRDLVPAAFGRLLKRARNGPLNKNEFWALRDVCFQVNRAEALAIIGPNGAGKSTILKLLCGLMKPTSGDMRVNGTLSALIEVGAGFHPDLTGRENIFLNGTILGMRKEEIKKKFDEIVDFSGLSEFIETPVKRYSSGMYAKLGFAVAAHVNPDILIVDEVLSVGDFVFQSKCIEKMNSIIKDGATVIFVSHNLKAVTELCSRAILLDRGKITKEGSADDMVQQYLSSAQTIINETHDRRVFISGTELRSESGDNLQFSAGEKVLLDVDITAQIDCEKLTLWIGVMDDNLYRLFYTSTRMLNGMDISLSAGETRRLTFELLLHLAPGTFQVSAIVLDDSDRQLDVRFPAATIYMRGAQSVGGKVNLYPGMRMYSAGNSPPLKNS